MRYLLVDGQGNFGSIDGDSAGGHALYRSTHGRIADGTARGYRQGYGRFRRRTLTTACKNRVLPARLPNLLLNGSTGIAVGMATNIPPHNLSELCDALDYIIDHYDDLDEITVDDLMQFVNGPDFPTGAQIVGTEGIKQAYATGKGRVVMRALAEIEEMQMYPGRQRINITEIPYQVNKSNLIERIADLVHTGKLTDIADLRDESDRNGISIIIEMKRSAQPMKVLNQLYKYTPLQQSLRRADAGPGRPGADDCCR